MASLPPDVPGLQMSCSHMHVQSLLKLCVPILLLPCFYICTAGAFLPAFQVLWQFTCGICDLAVHLPLAPKYKYTTSILSLGSLPFPCQVTTASLDSLSLTTQVAATVRFSSSTPFFVGVWTRILSCWHLSLWQVLSLSFVWGATF